ncbi:MAG: methylthioribose-1-phosphate isomerase [Nitrospirae bacterium]|nr:MAG: methylthioribose-1-phosphate isomerase [Nitrospirota bacterium]
MMLDQSRLPLEVVYTECGDYRKVAEGIQKLWIRGAPAIGIAVAMGVALGAQEIKAQSFDEFMDGLQPIFETINATRPTAVNIHWAIQRIGKFVSDHKDETVDMLKKMLIEESQRILEEDVAVNRMIGEYGAQFIRDGDTILTHCNAGSLATGGFGTATAAMYVAKEQGKRIQVFADETRPVNQGARLTSWELMQAGIPVTLITDSSAGAVMKRGMIDLAIVGTDRTTRNGDVANKIGTYTVAVLCREHGIPFYVAAPLSSIDFTMDSGDNIPIEERHPDEVCTIWGHRVAPDGVNVLNLAFDVTPSRYVTAFFTEKGAFRPRDIRKLSREDVSLDAIRLKSE